jgi:DNA helicase-2/ATP-dependent DNA helicase PcrA
MKFIADFHVHSRFSRATAKNLDLENLYIAAQLKGITVIGTGDFTHPGWLAEIKEKLVPAESGMFELKKEFSTLCDQKVPKTCRREVRFMLVSEISNIYKKNNRTRKNHNLVFLSDFNQADHFVSKLDKIGNIRSDGRPILGLDARDLLEILLETDDQAFLIPAHIWTPWFSLFGSKSGFDSIDECFEDLTSYIFAVETGLSSDPEMNWRVSALDRMTLISNSDAHSPLKLGREANLFDTQLSFSAIKSAIKSGDSERFIGTIEFYPEEGKYHLDGHRNCHVRSWPDKTKKAGGMCPVCKKPMTLGVLYRVEELADRPAGVKPKNYHPYFNTIPLVEILSEVLKVGPNSKKVLETYKELLEKLGSELDILTTLDKDMIDSAGVPLLSEAITKVRKNDIVLLPGYDGEFGKIKIFNAEERQKLKGQKPLFFVDLTRPIPDKHKKEYQKPTASTLFQKFSKDEFQTPREEEISKGELNAQQRRAVENNEGAMIIIAGPGTGKTRTLTHKMAFLTLEEGVLPENILAVTFTNKAAQEMRRRLEMLLKKSKIKTFVGTFHSLCFHILKQQEKYAYTIIDEKDREILLLDAIRQVRASDVPIKMKPKQLLKQIISAKQNISGPNECSKHIDDSKNKTFQAVYQSYQELLAIQRLWDYEDLIFKTVRLLESKDHVTDSYRKLFQYVFVDEYQDLNHGQYRIIKALVPPGIDKKICVVGDPNQSIYGFRGSSAEYFKRFVKDYPDAQVIKLTQNYRSTQTILDGSYQVIRSQSENSFKERIYSEIDGKKNISVIESGSEKSEAVAIGKTIEQLMGGIGFHSIDFGHVKERQLRANFGFSDFAVLYRTSEQSKVLSQVFDAAGIPYQIVSRENILNSKYIADLVSLLRVVEGTGSYADFERCSKITMPSMNKKSLEIFKNWCIEKQLPLESALMNARRFPIKEMGKTMQTKLVEVTGEIFKIKGQTKNMPMGEKLLFISEYTRLSKTGEWDQKTMEGLNHMVDLYAHPQADTKDLLKTCALQTDTDMYHHRSERVALMTMHASKGLEFPVVFICGCENGLLPFQPGHGDASNTEEERRLFYVAMTRAQERLYITFSKTRKIFGKIEKQTLSPFVQEIEKILLTHEAMALPKKNQTGQRQLKLF